MKCSLVIHSSHKRPYKIDNVGGATVKDCLLSAINACLSYADYEVGADHWQEIRVTIDREETVEGA